MQAACRPHASQRASPSRMRPSLGTKGRVVDPGAWMCDLRVLLLRVRQRESQAVASVASAASICEIASCDVVKYCSLVYFGDIASGSNAGLWRIIT